MKKGIFSAALCLCLITGVISSCGRSEDVSADGSAGELSQSLREDGELTPKPIQEPFVQAGTQIDGGEYHGLNWAYTDADELIIEGNLQDGPNDWYAAYEENIVPWGKYQKEAKTAVLAFSAGKETLRNFLSDWENLVNVYLSGLDTSSVTDMAGMFKGCSSLTGLNLSGLNTGSVTDMAGMFDGCSSLTSLDLSGLDTSSVMYMGGMFSGCLSLMSLDLRGLNTSGVTSMMSMFNECNSLMSLDLSDLNTDRVTNMTSMFYGCSSLTSLDLRGLDTGSVIYMTGMFYGCSSLKSLDLSDFDTSGVTDMKYMFYGCDIVQEILVGNDWVAASECEQMFNKCGVDHVTYK